MGFSLLLLSLMPNILWSMHIPFDSESMRQLFPKYSQQYTLWTTLFCSSYFSNMCFFNSCSYCLWWSSSRFFLSISYFLRFSPFSLLTFSSIIFAYLWSICICFTKYWYLFCTAFTFYSIYFSLGSIIIALPPWILSIYYCSILCNFYWWDPLII